MPVLDVVLGELESTKVFSSSTGFEAIGSCLYILILRSSTRS
jgi:hypothetical protein